MTGSRIVAIGASAGGVEPLLEITRSLPRSFPAAVCVVLHVNPRVPSLLPTLVNRAHRMDARHPVDGEPMEAGHIYIAPPDRHLLVEPGRLRLGDGPREARSRPAVDVLFRSIARAYGPLAIGVVLSGALDDGTEGLVAIKRAGGIAIVQDPDTAYCPSMPRNALDKVEVDHVVSTAEIAPLLEQLLIGPEPDRVYR